MGGFLVEPGAIAARAGTVDTAAGQIADVAAMIGGVDAGGMPPRTGCRAGVRAGGLAGRAAPAGGGAGRDRRRAALGRRGLLGH